MHGTKNRVRELTAEKVEPFVRLNEYKMSKQNLKGKVPEEEAIIKAMKESIKRLERKTSSLQKKSTCYRKLVMK